MCQFDDARHHLLCLSYRINVLSLGSTSDRCSPLQTRGIWRESPLERVDSFRNLELLLALAEEGKLQPCCPIRSLFPPSSGN